MSFNIGSFGNNGLNPSINEINENNEDIFIQGQEINGVQIHQPLSDHFGDIISKTGGFLILLVGLTTLVILSCGTLKIKTYTENHFNYTTEYIIEASVEYGSFTFFNMLIMIVIILNQITKKKNLLFRNGDKTDLSINFSGIFAIFIYCIMEVVLLLRNMYKRIDDLIILLTIIELLSYVTSFPLICFLHIILNKSTMIFKVMLICTILSFYIPVLILTFMEMITFSFENHHDYLNVVLETLDLSFLILLCYNIFGICLTSIWDFIFPNNKTRFCFYLSSYNILNNN